MTDRAEQSSDNRLHRLVRKPASRGEIVLALLWLCAAAAISGLMEIVYLTWRLPLPGGHSIAFPLSIVFAAILNYVLCSTARLWSRSFLVTAAPLVVWLLVVVSLVINPAFGGRFIVAPDLRSVLLVMAGIVGGMLVVRNPAPRYGV
ncbi:hypothetical protein ACFPVT_00595 [Corynebacterium choanae]|uniref:Uncharacterized protein n=1 Tax=Corynebacterium choanae TaxID=1862358 RepID=A0A3G6J5H3_9CORY|nr:hypothetical protein [Corynebacterium choanae]AZA13216.1 hypothetical protein CCHOA_04035 [Corynebacterium choanae]